MALYQCEDELDRLILQLRASLHKFESLDEKEQSDRYNEALLLIERTKVAERNYQTEINGLKFQTKQSHLARLKDKQQRIKDLKERLDELGAVVEKNEAKNAEKLSSSGNLTNVKKLVAWGDDIQDKTQESITRIKILTVESEKIGAEVTKDIARQTESLNRVQSTITAVDENVIRANATLKQIAKGVLTERFMQILLVLIILLSTAIVLMFVYGGKGRRK
ncbi:hypothetical protein BgAZ_304670 [Babesia gibsoni]|uniref:t-SNARE coiled-coil homology domain-containing protein n=1 Tax=Babesia gibsoni TaxID=33632 RepID=A0AAD8LIR2_BABGI|nr:hypothetical protein BgAZ_304670 [Babesia gibsoni]